MSEAHHSFANHFLIAMPGMADDQFAGSLVFVCEHTPQGALGLIVNRPTNLSLGELFTKIDLPLHSEALTDRAVLYGGPVQPERGFVLHERVHPEGVTYASSLSVPQGLEMTTSKDVLEAVAEGAGPQQLLITLGYSGWGAGQLEDEIAHNGWLTVEADHSLLFDTPVEERYDRALGLLGITSAAWLTQDAGHA